jgi:hypothetical protein
MRNVSIIRRPVLAVKRFSNALKMALDEVVKSVDFMQESLHCVEMGSSCTTVDGI